jgi:RNHCP domain-containing protein
VTGWTPAYATGDFPLSRTHRRSDRLRRFDPEEQTFLEPNSPSNGRSNAQANGRRYGPTFTDRDARNHARHEPASFRCVHCGVDVPTSAPGTAHRNHCPSCLWSRHVDDEPGDRASDCLASMEAIAITVRGDGEWVLIHRCAGCGVLHSNRIAGDDNPLLLIRLAVKPLAQPPFPLDRLSLI